MCQKPHPRSQLRSVSGLRTKANLLNTTASDLLFYTDFSLKFSSIHIFTLHSDRSSKGELRFFYSREVSQLSPDQSAQALNELKMPLLKRKHNFLRKKVNNEKSVPIIIQVKVVIAKVTLLCGEVDLITQQT